MTDFVNSWLYNEDDNYYSNPTEFFTSSDWNGFKIGYTSEPVGNFTQIYSSESTYSGLRPTLTFEYEYINPSCINDGAIYSFINSASGKYLTVDNGNINAGTNIYQYTKNNSRSQAFRIEKDSYYDYLRIVSMCNDDGDPQSVLSFCYDATITESGYTYQNAELDDNDDDSEYNDLIWYIIPHNGSDSLFKIVSGADPNLALTAYGTANGTASGTTNTSAGNVFVSRFTGASNQLWKLESGGCQVLNYTEDIRDVTQPKTVSESSTTLKFGLLVENFGDYISWASTNTAVAAIDSSGKVTAKKAGTTRIYVHIYYADGGEAEYSVTVYVTLANKTYYINNVSNNFRIEYKNVTDLSENAILEAFNGGTSEPTDRYKMFKFKHLGNSVYSIRSMLDNRMGWTNVSGKLVMTTIGTSDSAIPENAKWKINSNSNGYYFVSMASSSSMVVTSPDTNRGNILLSQYSNSNSKQNWTIKPITASYHGVTLKNKTNKMLNGTTFQFSAVAYSTYNNFTGNDGFTWSVTSGTGQATINSRTGVLTANSVGTVTVNVKYATQNWTADCLVHIIPIEEGDYYFKNAETSKYMQPDDNGDLHMEQHEFDSTLNQRWHLRFYNESYYYIINNETNKYLTAPNNSTDGSSILESDYDQATQSRQLWSISKIPGRTTYKIQSKNQINSNLVLAVGWGANWNGINIEQRSFSSDSNYKDEWTLQSINCILPTPLIRQATDSWCWAASAQMLARTNHPTDANNYFAIAAEEQRAAVYHVFGDDTSTSSTYDWNSDPQGLNDVGGTYRSVANAAAYLVGTADGNETFSGYATPYLEDVLLRFLLDGHAVARLCLWATVDWINPSTLEEWAEQLGNFNPNIGGHVTVIVGAEWSDDDQCYYYIVYDPWKRGEKYRYSYNDLCYKTTYENERYKTSVWYPTVVTKTEYSNKTFLEEIIGFDYSSK